MKRFEIHGRVLSFSFDLAFGDFGWRLHGILAFGGQHVQCAVSASKIVAWSMIMLPESTGNSSHKGKSLAVQYICRVELDEHRRTELRAGRYLYSVGTKYQQENR